MDMELPDREVTPIIPAPGRLRQEDHEFKSNLGYIY
jgi:hypothetical protein